MDFERDVGFGRRTIEELSRFDLCTGRIISVRGARVSLAFLKGEQWRPLSPQQKGVNLKLPRLAQASTR